MATRSRTVRRAALHRANLAGGIVRASARSGPNTAGSPLDHFDRIPSRSRAGRIHSVWRGMIMSLLRVENLRTYFDTRSGVMKAVDGINLDVREGSTLGIVGESGSGKSVTALSIMRLIERPGRLLPGSHIYFEGKDLAAISERELEDVRGNRMSMVFQEPMTSLNPVHTVGNQIIEAIRLHRRMSPRQARGRAIELLELVGIPSPERRVDAF